MRLPRPAVRALGTAAALCAVAAAVAAFTFFPGPGGVPCIWPPHFSSMHASPTALAPASFYGASFRAAAATWGTNPQSDFRWFVGDGFNDPQYGDLDGANDAYLAPLGYAALGVTYVYKTLGGGDLYDCDVALNSDGSLWAPGAYDFQTTALHELGHALGLGHTWEFPAVMYPFGYPGEQLRSLQVDDLAGEAFLYPRSGGGGGGGGPPPPSAPVRRGTVSGLTVSTLDVLDGDPLTFSATVTNGDEGPLLLSGAQTVPASAGSWTEVLMEPGEVRAFDLVRTVAEIPGLYALRLHLGGIDPTMTHVAQQEAPWYPVRVRRTPIPVRVQDDLSASLGPLGDDRVEVFLARGQRVLVDFRSSTDWDGARTVALADPSGKALGRWTPGRPFRARAAGVHALVVTNGGEERGSYRVFTEALTRPRRIRARGVLDGSAPAEIPFAAWGRTTVLLEARGPKALAPRITALRSPSGAALDVVPGTEVLVEEFGEDGTWTAVVEGSPGVPGKVKVLGRPTWLEGMQTTR